MKALSADFFGRMYALCFFGSLNAPWKLRMTVASVAEPVAQHAEVGDRRERILVRRAERRLAPRDDEVREPRGLAVLAELVQQDRELVARLVGALANVEDRLLRNLHELGDAQDRGDIDGQRRRRGRQRERRSTQHRRHHILWKVEMHRPCVGDAHHVRTERAGRWVRSQHDQQR